MNEIEVFDELMPGEDLVDYAKGADSSYKELYDALTQVDGVTPTKAIKLISAVHAEKVYLLIGSSLRDYDKKVIRGIVERYVAGIVFEG